MEFPIENIGAIDNRFLGKSIGLLNPEPPIVADANATLFDALTLLQQHKTGSVAIVDGEKKLCGIFTERDAVLKVALKGHDLKQVKISTVMTKSPKTASMTTTVAFALHMMSQGGYRHIPIVDEENFPLAMISVKDILDHLAATVLQDLRELLD